MSESDEIAKLKAEIAYYNARTKALNARIKAAEKKIEFQRARARKSEYQILKMLVNPNFPDAKRQEILAKLRAFGSEV